MERTIDANALHKRDKYRNLHNRDPKSQRTDGNPRGSGQRDSQADLHGGPVLPFSMVQSLMFCLGGFPDFSPALGKN